MLAGRENRCQKPLECRDSHCPGPACKRWFTAPAHRGGWDRANHHQRHQDQLKRPVSSAKHPDLHYQDEILQHVSRTFALTIPQLPGDLGVAVGNAYLLCRIADTIEDDAELDAERQQALSEQFIAIVERREPAEPFARELAPALWPGASAAERDLIANTPRVVAITHGLNETRQRAMARCVRIMSRGMSEYQHQESLAGVPDMAAMDRYCYFVAGVVGEMLTELFCDHDPAIRARREELMRLSVSFGQGLQMTNILKDIWEDRERGACWLPRDVFARHGVDLATLPPPPASAAFAEALGELLAIAHAHLRNALTYTLLIPAREQGIRRFCLWAIGMAVLTLRRLDANRRYSSGAQVKISRRSVKATVAITSAFVGSDRALRALFALAARGLPSLDERTRLETLGWRTDGQC